MKPLLLVVDDDRAVLNALETELRLSFDDVCAIEGFERPRDVLEMLPKWRASGRRVAVAVVDQKMPEISGTELVRRLRSWSIGADDPSAGKGGEDRTPHEPGLQTMILTGYGGPDVQADASRSGVELYREKPWNGARLRSDVAGLIESYRKLARGLGIEDVGQQDPTPRPSDRETTRLGTTTEHVDLPDPETLLACVYGYASRDQRQALTEALERSAECRRIFVELLRDLPPAGN